MIPADADILPMIKTEGKPKQSCDHKAWSRIAQSNMDKCLACNKVRYRDYERREGVQTRERADG